MSLRRSSRRNANIFSDSNAMEDIVQAQTHASEPMNTEIDTPVDNSDTKEKKKRGCKRKKKKKGKGKKKKTTNKPKNKKRKKVTTKKGKAKKQKKCASTTKKKKKTTKKKRKTESDKPKRKSIQFFDDLAAKYHDMSASQKEASRTYQIFKNQRRFKSAVNRRQNRQCKEKTDLLNRILDLPDRKSVPVPEEAEEEVKQEPMEDVQTQNNQMMRKENFSLDRILNKRHSPSERRRRETEEKKRILKKHGKECNVKPEEVGSINAFDFQQNASVPIGSTCLVLFTNRYLAYENVNGNVQLTNGDLRFMIVKKIQKKNLEHFNGTNVIHHPTIVVRYIQNVVRYNGGLGEDDNDLERQLEETLSSPHDDCTFVSLHTSMREWSICPMIPNIWKPVDVAGLTHDDIWSSKGIGPFLTARQIQMFVGITYDMFEYDPLEYLDEDDCLEGGSIGVREFVSRVLPGTESEVPIPPSMDTNKIYPQLAANKPLIICIAFLKEEDNTDYSKAKFVFLQSITYDEKKQCHAPPLTVFNGVIPDPDLFLPIVVPYRCDNPAFYNTAISSVVNKGPWTILRPYTHTQHNYSIGMNTKSVYDYPFSLVQFYNICIIPRDNLMSANGVAPDGYGFLSSDFLLGFQWSLGKAKYHPFTHTTIRLLGHIGLCKTFFKSHAAKVRQCKPKKFFIPDQDDDDDDDDDNTKSEKSSILRQQEDLKYLYVDEPEVFDEYCW